jgi:NitT/TauT family transport system permease protein/sulfonate transport system permease protein
MKSALKRNLKRLVLLLLLASAWQLFGNFSIANLNLVPTPLQVARAVGEMIANGQLLSDALASLQRVLIGFLLAAISGTIFGMLLAWLGKRAVWFDAPFELLRPVPPIAWIPLAVLWLGIGELPAYFIVFLGAFFPILTTVHAVVQATEKTHINAARCLGANRKMLLTDVILPSALPGILTAFRVGFGVAWICVITAELVGAQSGLGYMIQLNRLLLRTDKVVAGMVVIGCLGFIFNLLFLLTERKLVHWRTPTSLN